MKKKKQLVDAADPQCFWVNGGPVVRNLKELKTALEDMSDEQFKHHCQDGSDFAAWVRDVLGDSDCARSLEKVRTRRTAISKVKDCLLNYKK